MSASSSRRGNRSSYTLSSSRGVVYVFVSAVVSASLSVSFTFVAGTATELLLEVPPLAMHSRRKFHAVTTSGLISRSLPVTAMEVLSYTRPMRRRIASCCNARISATLGNEASRRAWRRGGWGGDGW